MQEEQQQTNPGDFEYLYDAFLNDSDSSEHILDLLLDNLLPSAAPELSPSSILNISTHSEPSILGSSEEEKVTQQQTPAIHDLLDKLIETAQEIASPSSVVYNTPPTITLSNSPIPPLSNNNHILRVTCKSQKQKVCKQQKMFRKYKGSEKWKEEMFEKMIAMQTQQQSGPNNSKFTLHNQ